MISAMARRRVFTPLRSAFARAARRALGRCRSGAARGPRGQSGPGAGWRWRRSRRPSTPSEVTGTPSTSVARHRPARGYTGPVRHRVPACPVQTVTSMAPLLSVARPIAPARRGGSGECLWPASQHRRPSIGLEGELRGRRRTRPRWMRCSRPAATRVLTMHRTEPKRQQLTASHHARAPCANTATRRSGSRSTVLYDLLDREAIHGTPAFQDPRPRGSRACFNSAQNL